MDIGKRLLDYGFHAPTVYFPLIVPEALMIEPTETESRETLDAFADALLTIAEEPPELLHDAPCTTAVSRPDEVTAAKKPVLRWTPSARAEPAGRPRAGPVPLGRAGHPDGPVLLIQADPTPRPGSMHCRSCPARGRRRPVEHGRRRVDARAGRRRPDGGDAAHLRVVGADPEPRLFPGRSPRPSADPRWRAVPLVRRATGGGAIWHDRELTYAVALPTTHPLARRPKDLYRAIHAAIARLLADRSIAGPPPGRGRGPGRPRPPPALLPATATPRTSSSPAPRSSAVPGASGPGRCCSTARCCWPASAATPELPGLAEVAPRWRRRARALVARGVGCDRRMARPWGDRVERPLLGGGRIAIAEIADGVYRDPGWLGGDDRWDARPSPGRHPNPCKALIIW